MCGIEHASDHAAPAASQGSAGDLATVPTEPTSNPVGMQSPGPGGGAEGTGDGIDSGDGYTGNWLHSLTAAAGFTLSLC